MKEKGLYTMGNKMIPSISEIRTGNRYYTDWENQVEYWSYNGSTYAIHEDSHVELLDSGLSRRTRRKLRNAAWLAKYSESARAYHYPTTPEWLGFMRSEFGTQEEEGEVPLPSCYMPVVHIISRQGRGGFSLKETPEDRE